MSSLADSRMTATEGDAGPNPGPADERVSTPEFWRGRKVMVTGGDGFVGSHIVARLRALGCENIALPRKEEHDLTRQDVVERLLDTVRPDTVIHLAAEVGGIGANRASPGRFFYANLMMGVNLIEAARVVGVDRFVQVGTICAYPKHTPVPFREADLWNGYPEETNAPYGIAKKALLVQLQAYRRQYGFPGIYLLPVNLYGPRDNFDLTASHVIPALIRKMLEAMESGAKQVVLWGTGEPSREFLYVDDCARAILLATEHYTGEDPVNIGTGSEIRIRDLAALIAELVDFQGGIVYDASQPDGQPRRRLDTTRALDRFGFRAHVTLRDGLRRTIDWYRAARAGASPQPTEV